MSICRDLSFLDGIKSDQFHTITQQFFNSCFPGIKTWLLNRFYDESNGSNEHDTAKKHNNNELIRVAFKKYRERINKPEKTLADTNIIEIIDDIIKIYTRYYNIYYSHLIIIRPLFLDEDAEKSTDIQYFFKKKNDAASIYSNFLSRKNYISDKWNENINLDKPINNTNIYDRLKLKIKELMLLINSNKTDNINLKIRINKRYINNLFKTINNLSQYQKKTNVKIATFLSELEPINKEIINSELLEYKYTDIPGESLRSEIEIIYINTDNNTAFIKYTSIKKSDTWINLEYLDL
jgi:hypothetical protein